MWGRLKTVLSKIKGIRILRFLRLPRLPKLPKIGVPKGVKLYLSLGSVFIIIVIVLLNFTGIISFKKWKKQIATTKTYSIVKKTYKKRLPKVKNLPLELKTKWKNYIREREKKRKEREKDELVLLRKKLNLKKKQLTELEKGLKRKEREIEQKKLELAKEKSIVEREKKRLKIQQKSLKKRESEFKKKELKWAQRVEAKTAELKEEKTFENVERLAKIYQEMRPEKSAEIIVKLDDKLIIKLFKEMKERNISRILAAMKTEDAARISVMISKK